MLIGGTKTGASIWFVLWGRKETIFNMNLYKTSTGLKKWVIAEEWSAVPVVRLGRIEITEAGSVERETWESREEFLDWYDRV